MLQLRVEDGPDAGSVHPLEVGAEPLCIGRRGDLVVRDTTASRRHAEVRCVGADVLLRDCGSRNGTVLNDRLLAPGEEAPIGPGDTIRIGHTRFMVEELGPRDEARDTPPPWAPPRARAPRAPVTPYAFISYSHDDSARVLPIVDRLRGEGVAVWLDREGIAGGGFWSEAVANAIRRCRVLLLLLTERSAASDCTAHELALAAERGIPILPVRLADVAVPPRLELYLAGIQYVELRHWPDEGGWGALLAGLERAGIPAERPRPAFPHVPSPTPDALTLEPGPPEAGAPVAPPLPPELAGLLADPVTLSSSEMSHVVRGRHPRHGDVVLKVLRQVLDEAREWLASDLYGDLVGSRLLDRGETADGEPYFLFRFLDGVPLSQAVRPDNCIRGALLDTLIEQILEQLAPLHLAPRTVVHRDVTPANLILSFREAVPSLGLHVCRVRLIDFECACFADSPQTPIVAHGFTPIEQRHGLASPASDLYALVSTASFLATGTVPPEPAMRPDGCDDFPRDALGTSTALQRHGGHDRFLAAWHLDPARRPPSAADILPRRRGSSDTTRMHVRGRDLGRFRCGDAWEVDLRAGTYYARPTPPPADS